MASPIEAFKTIEEELQALRGLPDPASFPETIGRTLKEGYLRGIKAPLAVGGAALGELTGALGQSISDMKKGFDAQTAMPGKIGGPPQEWFDQRMATPPVEAAPEAPAPAVPVKAAPTIQAFKDAQGRTTFTNQPDSYTGQQEISYDAATAALRPEGRQAGGVSSPVARDDQGRPTMVPDYELARTRKQEVEDLSHKAIVQQLQDQANPQVKVQRDMEAATQIANIFTPEEADIQAQVEQAFKLAQVSRPDIPPEVLRQAIEQGIRNRVRDNRQAAIQEYLNKERYPGSTLSGYGGQLRGEAADITSR